MASAAANQNQMMSNAGTAPSPSGLFLSRPRNGARILSPLKWPFLLHSQRGRGRLEKSVRVGPAAICSLAIREYYEVRSM